MPDDDAYMTWPLGGWHNATAGDAFLASAAPGHRARRIPLNQFFENPAFLSNTFPAFG
jgi:hypothetical protein